MNYRRAMIFVIFGALALAGSARAIVVGQVDDFQDGTVQNWANGGAPGAPPVLNVPDNGPAGAGDNSLQINSQGGVGPGSHLTVFNHDQWFGDYVAAGVTAIEVDLQNQGDVALNIRLAFRQSPTGQIGYLSSPIFLPAQSDWTHAVFLLNSASLVAVGGPSAVSSFFTDIEDLRIINEAGTANLSGDAVVAQLGIDNIRAVPEPGVIGLTTLGLLGLACFYRRNR